LGPNNKRHQWNTATTVGSRFAFEATTFPVRPRATRPDGNGFTTIYRYDNNRRLSEIEYPDGKRVQYAFDDRGNKTFEGHVDPEQNFAATSRTFQYDELNRLRSMTDSSLGKTIQYEFDENGNRSKVIDAEGGVTRWEYDRNNRPVKVTDPDGSVTRFEYDAAGRRTKVIYGNGVWTEYRYDASSQLTHMITRDRTNLTLQGWYYRYDLRGNRTSKTDHAGNVESYSYDALGRLIQTTYPDGRVVNWSYDAVGNRLTQQEGGSVTTYTYNAANQIQTMTSPSGAQTTFGFDANGNMTQKNEPSGTTYYTWDFENRLRQVVSTTGVTHYGYDSNGTRVFKESGGVRTDYLIDTVSVLAEYEAGTRTASYVLGPRIDEIISARLSAISSQPSAGETQKYWYLTDALGSVSALTDTAGRVIKTYRYGAWGEDAGATGLDIRNPYRWTGREWDPTGLQYNRARYYASAMGRWLSEDPVFPGADIRANLFAYGGLNPITLNDPMGLWTVLELVLAIAAFVGAVLMMGWLLDAIMGRWSETGRVLVAPAQMRFRVDSPPPTCDSFYNYVASLHGAPITERVNRIILATEMGINVSWVEYAAYSGFGRDYGVFIPATRTILIFRDRVARHPLLPVMVLLAEYQHVSAYYAPSGAPEKNWNETPEFQDEFISLYQFCKECMAVINSYGLRHGSSF
jgi:RHS repeat-associated protein